MMSKVFNIKDKAGLSVASGTNIDELLGAFCKVIIDAYTQDQFKTGNTVYYLIDNITYEINREYAKKLLEDMVYEIENGEYSYKIGCIHATYDFSYYFTLEIL